MKAYLAAGWFSVEQEASRQCVMTELKKAGIAFYSPKEDGLHIEGETNPQDIFEENMQQIANCDFVVASTAGKDLGTLFECGAAHAIARPIVYFWYNGFGKFNLMLSQSGHQVSTTPRGLGRIFERIVADGFVTKRTYEGDVE